MAYCCPRIATPEEGMNYLIKINKQQFYLANEGIEIGTLVTTVQITWAKINRIKLREPLEIQTIHPKKSLK